MLKVKKREKIKTIKHKERRFNICIIGIYPSKQYDEKKFKDKLEEVKLRFQFISRKIIPYAKQDLS